MRKLILLISMTLFGHVFAGSSFKNLDGQRLKIVPLQGNEFLIYYENFGSVWDGKVQKAEFESSPTVSRYVIKTKTKFRLRPYDRYYTIYDAKRKTLQKGSLVKEIEVFVKGHKKGHKLFQIEEEIRPDQEIIDLWKGKK